jgi:antirestriction protein ArdC
MKSKKPKRDLWQEVADRIDAALAEGTVPWRKPWKVRPGNRHHNPTSGTIYKGINPFLLELTAQAMGYTDPRWLTFKQAVTKGGGVRKGEKGTGIIFFKMLFIKDEDEQGNEVRRRVPMIQTYTVFNVEQTEGIEWPALATDDADHFDPIAECEQVMDGYAPPRGPKIDLGGSSAHYVPAWDSISLPIPEDFDAPEFYYNTAFHEMAHSTGHKSRLDRNMTGAFGSKDYAREELVGEMTAAMLCAWTGINPNTEQQSAAYINHWRQKIADDPKLIVVAAQRAQKAADFILGVSFEDKPEQEQAGAQVQELVAA